MYSGMGFISTSDIIPIISDIPTVPFDFNDGVLLKSETELKALDLSSLMLYGSTLSTSVALQTSTLLQNYKIQGLYRYLKTRSQSTIDGINSELITNTGLLSMYQGMQRGLEDQATVWEYDDIDWTEVTLLEARRQNQAGGVQRGGGKPIFISTLKQFDRTIGNQIDYMQTITSTISSYSGQYDSSVSSIAKEMSSFVSATKAYSTAVWAVKGYQDLLAIKQGIYDTTQQNLDDATRAEQASSTLLIKKRANWVDMSHKLSTLYDNRKIIGSTLTQYRINEAGTYIKYQSSLAGLSTTSSIYHAARVNEEYALAFSELTRLIAAYSDAEVQFNTADALYSVAGGAATTASSASGPSSASNKSALFAARQMAAQQLEAASTAKLASQVTASRLLSLATLANTRAYESILQGYDIRIDAYNRTRLQYKGYKDTANSNVTRFSSIYEVAVTGIKQYTDDIKRYSTFYESSINGASTLLGLSKDDISTIRGDYDQYEALTLSIAGLQAQYEYWKKKYANDIAASTLYSSQYYSSLSSITNYTAMYNEANNMIARLQNELYGVGGLMSRYYAMRFTNSSINNYDIIAQEDFDTRVKYLTNKQEYSMQQYRETFCRDKEVFYQKTYTDKIYDAVLFAQSNSLPAADLDTPAITDAGKSLNDINNYIMTFSNVYTMYNTQSSNIENISTSVGNEATAWSTVDRYTWGQYFQTMSSPNLPSLVNSSIKYLTLHQSTTAGLLTTFQSQQGAIDTAKQEILTGLQPFFTDAEISAQSDIINSFVTISSNDAIGDAMSNGFFI